MKKLILALSVLGVGVAGVAIADEHAHPGKAERKAMMDERFAALDLDGNGAISKAEMDAEREARFLSADTDGDGLLTQEEMSAQREAERAERMQRFQDKRFAKLDTDGDGAASLEEFMNPSESPFDRMDKDDDGELTKDEMKPRRKFKKRDEG
ncbi:MAG: hypothetical protein AAGB25_01060 [Pseudomonadota bacterium]